MPQSIPPRTVRVLQSTAAPGRTTKFVDQIVTDAPEDVRFSFFSWRNALVGRYDVFHVHWPEFLIRASSPVTTAAKAIAFTMFVARLHIRRTPVVRTVHNLEPHDAGPGWERTLLERLDRLVTHRIVLNTSTPGQEQWPSTNHIPHGHYIDRFADAERSGRDEHRIVSVGRIEAYKNVPGLIAAFAGMADSEARLRVVGLAAGSLRDRIERDAEQDPRVSLDLRYVSDEQLVHEVTGAALVVLPYTELHSSGVALVALSLGRPILAPASPTMLELQREVGDDWVFTFTGALDAAQLTRALAGASGHLAEARPDMRNRDWPAVARAHSDVYQAAVGRERRVSTSRTGTAVFVNPSGQRENLGDSVLRRPYLDALRATGLPLTVLVTGDPRFTSGLGLESGDRIVRSKRRWLLLAARSALRGETVFALNAGEIVLDPSYRSQAVWVVPLAILTRLRGGAVVAAGIGLRGGTRSWRRSVAVVLRLAAVVSWRDPEGRQEMRRGTVHPDWAFVTGRDTATLRATSGPTRDRLVISVRGDRPAPPEAWHAAVRQLATTLDARPLVLSQVGRDIPRGLELAAAFDCEHVAWTDADHAEQEAEVRAVYGSAVAVVSDRIHSLIIGLTEGAVPVGLTPGDPEKVARTFYFAGDHVPVAQADALADAGAFAARVAAIVDGHEHLDALDTARSGIADLQRILKDRFTTRARG